MELVCLHACECVCVGASESQECVCVQEGKCLGLCAGMCVCLHQPGKALLSQQKLFPGPGSILSTFSADRCSVGGAGLL